ncbi:glucosamine inositolphosphorylceramide transferase family protein [Methylocystis parvus]|uniref:glucosamine inositolphosphorylceramide transferase family protein n=1 Tax=Methylocystis parvus TaxID=134 RepID=UPI003C756267
MTSVRILSPEGELRRWHRKLFESLERDGVRVGFDWRAGPPRALEIALLDELERLLLTRRRDNLLDRETQTDDLPRWRDAADVLIDLTGNSEPAVGAVFPVYCGVAGDDARDAMLLAGAPPHVGLAKREGDRTVLVADARIALERPEILRSAREAVVTRLITLIRTLVRKGGADVAIAEAFEAPRGGSPAGFLAGSLIGRVRSRIGRLVAHENHWRVGWRALASSNDATQARLDWPADARWTWLEDDRRRYFADPFLFEKDGVVHLFCEEFPYETGKAVISWLPLDKSGGPAQPPRIVLETDCHLSYPFLFQWGGEIWMMPESSSSRSLALYRADRFPEKWTLHSVLMEGLDISDATIFEVDGRWWMTASTREDEGSTWDCLSLFVADSPLGPWRRCGEGPVLIDATAARPAGNGFRRKDELWRPAQDCSAGYGSGLSLCRIDGLDERGLRQSVKKRLAPPPGTGASGVHTLNVGGGFETIDICGWRKK